MKKRFQSINGPLLILAICLIFSACHNSTNPGMNYIPKDANFVMSFNIKQVHDKLKDGNFNLDSLMNELKTQDSSFALLPFTDLKVPALLFMQYKSSMMAGQDFLIGWIQQLKDRSGFEKELTNVKPGHTIVKKDDYSYMALSDNSCYVWNNEVVALYTGKNIEDQIPGLFKLKKDASLADDNTAIKILSKSGDATIYSSSQDGLTNIPMLSMTKISDLIKGNYWGGTLNFEKGKVVVDGEGYLNKTVEDLIKKNPSKDINKAVLANFPGQPLGLFQVSLNLKQIFSFLDYAGVTSMIEGYMKNLGITLDDVAKAFSGEFAVALQAANGGDLKNTNPKMLAVVPVGDKSSFNKVMGALAKMGLFDQVNGQWLPKGMPADNSWAFHTDDKAVVFSSDKALSETYLSGSEKMTYPKELDFSGKTFVGYADLNSILTQLPAPANAEDSMAMALSLQTFDDIDMSASNIKGNHYSVNFILRLKDKSQNSLPLLMTTIINIKKLKESGQAKLADPALTDSVIVPLPSDLEESAK